MEKLLVGVLSLLIVSNVFSAAKKTDWEVEGLKGKVKERITTTYIVENKLGGGRLRR